MSEEDEKHKRKKFIRRFCEEEIIFNKVRDHCHLKGAHRAPAPYMRITDVTQKQSNFIPFAFHNFTNFDCLLFFRRHVDKKVIE